MDHLDLNADAKAAEATLARANALFAKAKRNENVALAESANKKAGGRLLAACNAANELDALAILSKYSPDLTMTLHNHTALMLASQFNLIQVVNELIEKGADVNAQKEGGPTALILACYHGHPEIANALIDAGANVNASDMGGSVLYQCLMPEVIEKMPEVVAKLKELGAVSVGPPALAKGGARHRNRAKSRKTRRNRNKQSRRQRRRS